MEYYFDSTLKKADLNKVEDKKSVAKTLLSVIAKLADSIEQTHYLQKLAEVLQVEEGILRDKLRQFSERKTGSVSEDGEPAIQQKDRFLLLAEGLMGLALRFPRHLNYIIDQLLPEYLPSDKLQKLYKNLVIYYTKKQVFDYSNFLESFSSEEKNLTTYCEVLSLKVDHEYKELDDDSIKQEIVNGIKDLKKHYIQAKLKDIEEKLRQAERDNNQAGIEEYSQKFSELTSVLSQIK